MISLVEDGNENQDLQPKSARTEPRLGSSAESGYAMPRPLSGGAITPHSLSCSCLQVALDQPPKQQGGPCGTGAAQRLQSNVKLLVPSRPYPIVPGSSRKARRFIVCFNDTFGSFSRMECFPRLW